MSSSYWDCYLLPDARYHCMMVMALADECYMPTVTYVLRTSVPATPATNSKPPVNYHRQRGVLHACSYMYYISRRLAGPGVWEFQKRWSHFCPPPESRHRQQHLGFGGDSVLRIVSPRASNACRRYRRDIRSTVGMCNARRHQISSSGKRRPHKTLILLIIIL